MKKYLVVLLLTVCSVALFAQTPRGVFPVRNSLEPIHKKFNGINNSESKTNHPVFKKENLIEGDVFLIDSVIEYRSWDNEYHYSDFNYDSEGNLLSYFSKMLQYEQLEDYARFTYTYNSKRKILSYLEERKLTFDWCEKESHGFRYDSTGNLLHEWYYWGDDYGETSIATHTSYTYDSNGNKLTEYSEKQDPDSLMYKPIERNSFTYDSYGKCSISFHEEVQNGKWVNISQYEYTYHSDGNIHIRLLKLWKDGAWVISGRVTNEYDSNTNLLSVVSESWINGQWNNTSRKSYAYDSNTNLLSVVSESWTNGQWNNSSRISYSYDSNANRLSELYENYKDNKWINQQKYSYTYNIEGNKVTDLEETWIIDKWENRFRLIYVYDSNGNLITWLSNSWQNEQWVEEIEDLSFKDASGNNYNFKGYKVEIKWKLVNSVFDNKSLSSFSVYPNPLSNSATIKYSISESSSVSINIYNALGTRLFTDINELQEKGEHQTFFNAGNYPSGVYYYTIQIGKTTECGKLILVK